MMERDPYGILGVARDAGDEEIRRAYRSRVKQDHPDAGCEGNDDRFRRLTDAYESIRTQDRRDEQDRTETGPSRAPRPPRAPGYSTPHTTYHRPDYAPYRTLDDLIASFLGGAGGPWFSRRSSMHDTHGMLREFRSSVHLSHRDAQAGVTLHVAFPDRDREVTVPPGTRDATRLTYRETADDGRTTVLHLTVYVS